MQKVFEHYVTEKTTKNGVTFEVETDCVSYDSKGNILKWELYSSAFVSWMPLDLDQVQNTWPSKFLKIQDEIDQKVHEMKRDRESEAV